VGGVYLSLDFWTIKRGIWLGCSGLESVPERAGMLSCVEEELPSNCIGTVQRCLLGTTTNVRSAAE
jgi:hypothetical protein